MPSLALLEVKDTYTGLIKLSDNSSLASQTNNSAKRLSDGGGNDTDIYIGLNRIGINASAPAARLHIIDATVPLRVGYDANNYTSFSSTNDGKLTIWPSGGETTFVGDITVDGGKISFGNDETISNESDGLVAFNMSSGEAARLSLASGSVGGDAAYELWTGTRIEWSIGYDNTDGDLHFGHHDGTWAAVGTDTKVKITGLGMVNAAGFHDTGVTMLHGTTNEWVETFGTVSGNTPQRKVRGSEYYIEDVENFRLSGKTDGAAVNFKISADDELTAKQLMFTVSGSNDGEASITLGSATGFMLWDQPNGKVILTSGTGKFVASEFEALNDSIPLKLTAPSGDVLVTADTFTIDPGSSATDTVTLNLEPDAGGMCLINLNKADSTDEWTISSKADGTEMGIGYNEADPASQQTRWYSNGDFQATRTGKMITGEIKSNISNGTNSTLILSAKSDLILNSNIDGDHGGGKDFIFKNNTTEVARIKANGDFECSGTVVTEQYQQIPFLYQTTQSFFSGEMGSWANKYHVPLFQGTDCMIDNHAWMNLPDGFETANSEAYGATIRDGTAGWNQNHGMWWLTPCDAKLAGMSIFFDSSIKPAMANWTFEIFRVGSGSLAEIGSQSLSALGPLSSVHIIGANMPNYNSGTPSPGGTVWVNLSNQAINKGDLISIRIKPIGDVFDEAEHQNSTATHDFVACMRGSLVAALDWGSLMNANIET